MKQSIYLLIPLKISWKHWGKVFISVYINQSCGRLGWSSQIFFDKFKDNWKSVSGEVQVGSLRQGQYLITYSYRKESCIHQNEMERVSSISDASFLAGFKVDKNNFKKRPIFAIYRGSDGNEDKETMRRMRWPQFAGPALHHHHQLTQIDPDWQRGILCFPRSIFPTPNKYLLHPKCTFLNPKKREPFVTPKLTQIVKEPFFLSKK